MAEKEYIERDELESRIKKYVKCRDADRETLEWAKDECIRQAHCMPAADVVEVRHGEWILEYGDYGKMICSVCKKTAPTERKPDPYEDFQITEFYIESQYCPNCGAKMDGGVVE